jgi:hypothetical protein
VTGASRTIPQIWHRLGDYRGKLEKYGTYLEGYMQDPFTLHCVKWNARAAMLEEVRAEAVRMGLLTEAEASTEPADKQCLHAMVLSENGKAIGCARVSRSGNAERLTVLTLENRDQIESALKLAAWLNADKSLRYA